RQPAHVSIRKGSCVSRYIFEIFIVGSGSKVQHYLIGAGDMDLAVLHSRLSSGGFHFKNALSFQSAIFHLQRKTKGSWVNYTYGTLFMRSPQSRQRCDRLLCACSRPHVQALVSLPHDALPGVTYPIRDIAGFGDGRSEVQLTFVI